MSEATSDGQEPSTATATETATETVDPSAVDYIDNPQQPAGDVGADAADTQFGIGGDWEPELQNGSESLSAEDRFYEDGEPPETTTTEPQAAPQPAPEPEATEPEGQAPEVEEAEAEEIASEPEETPEGSDSRFSQQKFRPANALQDKTVYLMAQAAKEGTVLDPAEARDMAAKLLGIKEEPSPRQESSPEPVLPEVSVDLPEGVPNSIDDVQTRLSTLRKEIKEAIAEVEVEKAETLLAEQEKLEDALPKLQEAKAKAESARAEQAQSQQQAAIDKAMNLYPTLQDENGDHIARAEEILRLGTENGLDRYSGPNGPLLAAQDAAAELGIAPGQRVKPKPAKPTPKATTSPSPAGMPPLSASGAQATDPAVALRQAIANASPEEMDRLLGRGGLL